MGSIATNLRDSVQAGIRAWVRRLVTLLLNPWSEEKRRAVLARALSRDDRGIDVYASCAPRHRRQNAERYITPLLKARKAVHYQSTLSIRNVTAAEIFVLWGIGVSKKKIAFQQVQQCLGRPLLIVEDGFIRSLDIGLSGEPALSIILDDTTAYYDATKISRLQRLLEEGPALAPAETQRARKAIDLIVAKRVSKYNHAPNLSTHVGPPGRKKLLLIDQKFGDHSVEFGLASEATFKRMLQDALARTDCDVIVKQHPDAIKGGKSSYFNNERLAGLDATGRLFPILYDVNPYALLNAIDEVYVVTSGMGFEALMAGKKVRCYGMPFYAGWGITQDHLTVPFRTRRRTVEDVFHYAYIMCSRYYHPEREQLVEVEELVNYIADRRGW